MQPRRNRVLGYARVSSEEQARGSSLVDQQNTIRAYAKSRSLAVARLYVESESGIREKAELRVEMQRLLGDVREGDVIVCAKLDRWSRDTEFTLRSVREILEKGASFYAVDDACDPSTRDGDMMMTMRAMFAKEEHKRIKERMVGTRRILRNQGLYTEGRLPLGYRRTLPKGHKHPDKCKLVIVPEDAEKVREMFRLYVSGLSLEKTGRELGVRGNRVHYILRSRAYLGEMKNVEGLWVKSHPAIIDVPTWQGAQDILSGNRFGRAANRSDTSGTRDWILRDVAICALCGSKMSSGYGTLDKKGHRPGYYRCFRRCTSSYLRVSLVEKEAEALIVSRLAGLGHDLAKGKAPPEKRGGTDYTSRKEALSRKRARLLEAHADGLTSLPELREALGRVDAERLGIEAREQTEAAPSVLASPRARRELLSKVSHLQGLWGKAQPVEKRRIVNILASSVGLARGVEPSPKWLELSELVVS